MPCPPQQGVMSLCGNSHLSGGRSFSCDINEALSMRLQPLRKCFCGCHTNSSAPEVTLQVPQSRFLRRTRVPHPLFARVGNLTLTHTLGFTLLHLAYRPSVPSFLPVGAG